MSRFAYTLAFLVVLLCEIVLAQSPLPRADVYIPTHNLGILDASTSVIYDSNQDIFVYRYRFSNRKGAKQRIIGIWLDTRTLTVNLVTPSGWDVDQSPMANKVLMVTYGVHGNGDSLGAGASKGGYGFSSYEIPTLLRSYALGYAAPPVAPDGPYKIHDPNPPFPNDMYKTWAIGPTPSDQPPRQPGSHVDPLPVISQLRATLKRLMDMCWVRPELEKSLRTGLNKLESNVRAGQRERALKELAGLLQRVERAHNDSHGKFFHRHHKGGCGECKKRYQLNDDSYYLLKATLEFLKAKV